MTEREYLILISKDFTGKDRDYLQHIAMHGTKPEIQAAIYEAGEVVSGREKSIRRR